MLYALVIFLFVVASFFAMVEIQIEGTAGWAKNLPTWRIEKHWLLDVFWGGRPLTGYHAWVFSFMFLLFHLPLFFVESFGWLVESRIIGSLVLFWAAEDFLWFILNPGYGIAKFKKENVPWHPRWFLGAPIDYWIFFPIGFMLIAISY